ncbi:hypothetical protein J2858_004457 [Neorhizobium galegae]|uniref:TfuA-like protein n=1 Tax=Neorhizobium galegae TaxID=399 RepID=UPI001AE44229|nr:hypothetical protein [Neorhizobium galegae]
MTCHTVVFAGPSIHGLDLSSFAGLVFRGSSACGDLLSAVHDGAQVIGLIDGLYGDCAAVWHKEILFALSKGVAVIGAASMGALRAAECEAFGMTGIGRVFEDYRDGRRVSDADVALSHAPADLAYRPLTLALVDAQATIDRLADTLGEDDHARLMAAACRLHFSRRTWRAIAREGGFAMEMADRLAGNAFSVKQADAVALLNLLQDGTLCAPPAGTWRFQHTLFFRSLLSRQQSGSRT